MLVSESNTVPDDSHQAARHLLDFARVAETSLHETSGTHASGVPDVARGGPAGHATWAESFQSEGRQMGGAVGARAAAPGHSALSAGQDGARKTGLHWKGGPRLAGGSAHQSLSAGAQARDKVPASWQSQPDRNPLKSRPSKQEEALHPIIRLGWGRLCDVHCNGLTGVFLGGHEKDLFVQCTGQKWQNAPLIDEKQGGSIMTCSQFEKLAGRELSKKWKESIHVIGEGEGSKATLIAWLKRRAEHDFGEGVVGHSVWVCSPAEGLYVQGFIKEYMRESGKHKVFYNERNTEELHLPVELLHWGAEKPSLPAGVQTGLHRVTNAATRKRQPTSMAAPAAMEVPLTTSALERTLSPSRASLMRAVALNGNQMNALFHAGSGMSVSSDWKVSPAAFNLNEDLEPLPHSARQGLLAHDMDDVRGGGLGRETPSPPLARSTGTRGPRSRRTIPTHMDVSEARTESCSDGSAPLPNSAPKRLRSACAAPSFGTPPLVQRSPLGVEGLVSEACALPEPPGEGDSLTEPTLMARWLNGVALALDDTLMAMAAATPSAAGEALLLSPAARFQAVLVHARRGASLPGYYLAMLSRYEHFRAVPQQQRLKLAEFILAALAQESAMLSVSGKMGAAGSRDPSPEEAGPGPVPMVS